MHLRSFQRGSTLAIDPICERAAPERRSHERKVDMKLTNSPTLVFRMTIWVAVIGTCDRMGEAQDRTYVVTPGYDRVKTAVQRLEREGYRLPRANRDSLLAEGRAIIELEQLYYDGGTALQQENKSLGARTDALNSEKSNLSQEIASFNSQSIRTKEERDRLQSAIDDFNRRLEDHKAALRDLNQRIEADNNMLISRYARFGRDADTAFEAALPDPQVATSHPNLVVHEPPLQTVKTETLPVRAFEWVKENRTEIAGEAAGLVQLGAELKRGAAFEGPAGVALAASFVAYDGLQGAEQAEDRKLKADLDRLRLLPRVIEKLDRQRTEWHAEGLPEEEVRRRSGEYARALVHNLPGTTASENEDRFVHDLLSRETEMAVLKSTVGLGLGDRAGKRLEKDFLQGVTKRIANTKKLLFEWSVEHAATESMK
jgi:hypothetical protein